MAAIVTRCYTGCGAIDLYHDIPDLKGATVENVEHDNKYNDHQTLLTLRDLNGGIHKILIAVAD